MKKFLALLALLSAPLFSHGQAVSTNGGSIQGTISDNTGAAISTATVTIASPETGYTHTLKVDRAGLYSLGPLTPGAYTISISAPGFQGLNVKTVVQTGTVTSGSERMTIGASTETVEVDAGVVQINTDQVGVAGVITQQQIDSLPINGRNILDIAQLEPGVILQSGESFDPTKAGYSAVSVGGVSGRTTRILLDGQDITDETVGTTIFNVPSGPIDEFQLNRSTQDVSGEVTSTGQVLLSTRSGTNKFHGNAFYNFQDYRTGFAADSGGLNAPFQRNQFGGYVGGPIIKDKLFFFAGGERLKQDASNPAQVATVFQAIATQYPVLPAPFRDTFSTARLDYNGPKGIHLFVRGAYSVNADDSTFGLIYSIYQNRDNVPSIVGGADFATGRFTHSFRGGYEKFHNILGDGTATLGSSIYNPTTASTGGSVTLYDPFDAGGFYAGPNYLAPQQTYQSDKQLRYDGTWTRGAHTLKFGASLNRILGGGFAEFFGASLFTEFGSFNLLPGCNPTAPCASNPTQGYSAYGYVLGNGFGSFSAVPGFGLPGGGVHDWRTGAYVADTWKATSYLTLVAGVRYSVDTDRANQNLPSPLCSSVNPSLQFAGCNGNTYLFDQYQPGLGGKTHQPYGDFGPQAGFVFSPGSHKMSLRGGIGIFYENTVFNDEGNAGPAVIQSAGKFQNQGDVCFGQSTAFLPGLGTVTATPDGTPLATVCNESIAQAAPEINALKAKYQAAVSSSTSANPSFIGTGGALSANGIYAKPFVEPYSIQFNGGIQRELHKGLIFSADYVHNATLKTPLTIDVNHNGAARFLNKAAAQNAIAATLTACGAPTINAAIAACPGLHTDPNTGAVSGAQIADFAGNGLDSGGVYLSGVPAQAVGLTANTGAAFPGQNPNVGNGKFILPIGRSGYDAAQIVLQQQQSHPIPGIVSSNIQISYTLSRVVSAAGGSQDQFFNPTAVDNDNPNEFIGRNGLDHSNEVSFGGSIAIKYGLKLGVTGQFFSAPPTTLTLDSTGGNVAQIFQTDVTGDGTFGDVVPGSQVGAYMHQIKGAGLNRLISSYNSTKAGTVTPAGQALIGAGLFTNAQLVALNGVQQPIATVPTTPLNNNAFRNLNFNASYPFKVAKYVEGLTIVPGVAIYNVTNMSNFGNPGGILLNTADGPAAGYLNGENSQTVENASRSQRGSGTFDAGGPRSTEFQLKVIF